MAPITYVHSEGDWRKLLTTNGDKLVVVDFTATWCGPCKRIAPLFEQLAGSTPNSVFAKVDVDEVQEVAASCGVRSMPTFQFYRGGSKIDQFSGADDAQLKATILKHAKAATFSGAGRTLADDIPNPNPNAYAENAPTPAAAGKPRAQYQATAQAEGLHPAAISIAVYGAFIGFLSLMLMGNPNKIIGIVNNFNDLLSIDHIISEDHPMFAAVLGAVGIGIGFYYVSMGLGNNLHFAQMTVYGRFMFMALMIWAVATDKTSAGWLVIPAMDVVSALVTRHFLR